MQGRRREKEEEEKSLTWEDKHSKHRGQDEETHRVIHVSWALLILICCFVLYKLCFLSFPPQGFRELPTLCIFSLLNVSSDSFQTEDALNPAQVVVGRSHTLTHTDTGSLLLAVFDLPLLRVLQHTEGPALCKAGGAGGRAVKLCWHWLKHLSITPEQS